MADDPLHSSPDTLEGQPDPLRSAEFAELRKLLLGYEQEELDELKRRIDALQVQRSGT